MKTFIAFILSFFVSVALSAQAVKLPMQYGFSLGMSQSNIIPGKLFPSSSYIMNGKGIRLGMLADVALTKNIGLIPRADLSLNSGSLATTNSKSPYEVMPQSLDLMTHLVLRTGHGKYRPYLLLGPELKLPLNDKTTSEFPTGVDLAFDCGLGFDKMFPRMAVAPELRYSAGILNVNRCPEFDAIYFHSVSLVVSFKGARKKI